MKSKIHKPYIIVHLEPNEPLLESLVTICKQYNIQTGVILSGIGQLKDVTIGYFKRKDDYMPQQFSETFELLSLSGTLVKHEQTYLPHIHVILGAENKKTYGGHLLKATVEITNEIIILDMPIGITRKKSENTGLMELKI